MIPAMQVLAIYGAIRSIGATTGPVFQGVGRPRIVTKIQFVELILLLILIYPLSREYGILGTSLAVLFVRLVGGLAGSYMAIKITICSTHRFFKALIFSFLSSGIMSLSILTLKVYWFDLVEISTFIMFILFAIFFYFIVNYLFSIFFEDGKNEVYKTLYNLLQSFR